MYAFKKTVRTLSTVLASDNDHVLVLAFVVSTIGFVLMQIAFDRGFNNISATIATALGTATLFFLSTVGFIIFISTLYVFAYNLSLGPKAGRKLPTSNEAPRAWRIALSFVVAGAATAAAFNCFSDGLREISFMRTQYALFLSDGDDGGALTPLVTTSDLGRRSGAPHGPIIWQVEQRSPLTRATGNPPVAAETGSPR